MKKINTDILRLIAAFMVVAIHTYPLSFLSDNIDYLFTRILFRVAVPFFLMITGYFILAKKDKKVLIEYTKKILVLYIISIVIYLPINVYNGYFHNINLFSLIKDVCLTGTFYHLWYFPATVIGLWVSFFLLNKLSLKKSLIITSVLYLIGIFGDNYYNLISSLPFINSIYKGIFFIFDYPRNFFLAPIFLIMGYLLKINKSKLTHKKLLAIIFTITMLIEGLICLKFNLYRHNSMYFSLIPLMYILFSLITENKNTNKDIRSISTYIYIIHPFFIVIMHFVSRFLPFINNSLVNFLLVASLSLIFAIVINIIIKKINVYNSSKATNL